MKTKSQKKYFSGGAISSVVGLATNAAQQLLSVSSYEADATQDPYKVNWGNVVSSGGIGLISELLKKKKDERQRAQMVLSATPGAYNNGGPIYKPIITNPKISNTTQPITQPSTVLNGLLGNMTAALPKQRGTASYSKSRDRFRERATGGPVGGPTKIDTTNTGFFGDDANQRHRPTPQRNPKPLKFIGVETDPQYQQKFLKALGRESGWQNSSGKLGNNPANFDKIGSVDNYVFIQNSFSPSEIFVHDTKSNKYASVPIADIDVLSKDFNIGSKSHGTPQKKKFSTGFATGGDIELSDSAFQVQGNPNQVDGNYYPTKNVRLDHNEVVKNRFVYSNQLTDPKTNQSFASLARLSEIAAGKAEKRLKTTPYDSISQNTIEFANKANQSLATTQEGVATRLGLRGNTNSYATGGSMDPGDPEYPYMLVEQQKMGLYTGTYYDPYKDRFLKRDRMGEYSVISDAGPGLRNKLSREAIEQHKQQYPINAQTQQANTPRIQETVDFEDPIANLKNQLSFQLREPSGPTTQYSAKNPAPYMLLEKRNMGLYTGNYYDPYTDRFLKRDRMGEYTVIEDAGPGLRNKLTRAAIEQHKRKYPMENTQTQWKVPDGTPLSSQGQIIPYTKEPVSPNTKEPVSPNTKEPVKGALPPTQSAGVPQSRARTVAETSPTNTLGVLRMPEDGSLDNSFGVLANQGLTMKPFEQLPMTNNKVESIRKTTGTTSPSEALKVLNNTTGQQRTGSAEKFTIGDALQGVEVLSKFGQLAGGPEREKAQYDNTSITKRIFDPTQALYQSQRSFDSSLSNLEVGSINARRAFANRMLATKLNADSQVATQYGQMNAGALTEYEGRISNQRRYNNAQTQTTNEINAQNRAAYKEAVDTAFNSLGNFGQALNAKKQGYDQIQILKSMYPEVYKRILNSYGG